MPDALNYKESAARGRRTIPFRKGAGHFYKPPCGQKMSRQIIVFEALQATAGRQHPSKVADFFGFTASRTSLS